MNNKLFVGNISWDATNEDLESLFAEFGEVTSARIVTDKFSGKSRGFGFVEMATEDQAQAAIKALDGKEFMGREIAVNIARPKEQ
ncbi:MAG: RNP-1 like protein RNA-binding protein [Candidatus Uhrbacteria bacterium GW2011_GWE2_40_58]|nr:MAG: RNP-1 like protein RNA-binding protein [Candidatus Uhrbacteria bacterium GW2011_GWF2_40_263]KKR67750.1 MAG: RNP-1 like protein RNA-binding protein [Candidatus Uhrbacteria bacterium GW2011_GWE2_40_58]OGL92191.1 MAG: RNA-binding protein [Candidatus Uhrbacteria bacterium RIFOXYA2_FULL_40_9]OGL96726.1 MAG: RNA-binding protein [Candidatus Uhrbacteria bacterium RIFOXYB2_FULL_41_18]HBK35301.1 RNA-binding protein [Candidatus Uhrbacteria bacterium]